MTLASLCSWAGRFESYLVENPEDRFSRDVAQMKEKTRMHNWIWDTIHKYKIEFTNTNAKYKVESCMI